MPRLNDTQRSDLFLADKNGASFKELMETYKVSRTTIINIRKNFEEVPIPDADPVAAVRPRVKAVAAAGAAAGAVGAKVAAR